MVRRSVSHARGQGRRDRHGSCPPANHRSQRPKRRASEERLRLLGDNLPDSRVPVCPRADGSVRFLYFSAGIERLNGVSVRRAARPGTLLRQIPPSTSSGWSKPRHAERDLSDFDMELPMRRPTAKCAGCDYIPVRAACPMAARSGTACRSTSPSKRAEEALQERAGVSHPRGGHAADRLGHPARWLEHLFQSTMGGLHRADAG